MLEGANTLRGEGGSGALNQRGAAGPFLASGSAAGGV